jgi:hypothetical protein
VTTVGLFLVVPSDIAWHEIRVSCKYPFMYIPSAERWRPLSHSIAKKVWKLVAWELASVYFYSTLTLRKSYVKDIVVIKKLKSRGPGFAPPRAKKEKKLFWWAAMAI